MSEFVEGVAKAQREVRDADSEAAAPALSEITAARAEWVQTSVVAAVQSSTPASGTVWGASGTVKALEEGTEILESSKFVRRLLTSYLLKASSTLPEPPTTKPSASSDHVLQPPRNLAQQNYKVTYLAWTVT